MEDYDESDEEEYEYTYDDDESLSNEDGSDTMDTSSIEKMDDVDTSITAEGTATSTNHSSGAVNSSLYRSNPNGLNANGKQMSPTTGSTPGSNKKKARSESLCSYIDVHMRDTDEGIQMKDSKELTPMMMERISEVAEVLGIPIAAAGPLLRNHKWSKERLIEAFCSDMSQTKEQAGVTARCEEIDTHDGATNNTPSSQSSTHHICGICFDDELTQDKMLAMPCGHEFCLDCWRGYITSKVSDGPSCILAVCPQDKCNEVMTEVEVLKAFADPCNDIPKRYGNYQLRNFVDVNGTSRWCPGPGCERVAVLSSHSGAFPDSLSGVIAQCDSCSTCFCIKCGEEPHSPATCRMLEMWKEKCRNESETANWILANTKPCPKCRSRIEKNQGCNHMTCQQCRYEFCWICVGDWKTHGANTGGYYNCNKFATEVADDQEQTESARAKRELDRYLHYYKRFHAHSEAQKFAKRQLIDTEKKMVALQEFRTNSTWTDVEFLKTANEQLVECRRVLKYTYAFAFYLTAPPKVSSRTTSEDASINEATDKKKGKVRKHKAQDEVEISAEDQLKQMQKERFEHHQEMLERFTEDLSELVEKPLSDINREQVVNQTRVVDRFMKNMLQYVDDGMEEVV